jgi:hypothetical protein
MALRGSRGREEVAFLTRSSGSGLDPGISTVLMVTYYSADNSDDDISDKIRFKTIFRMSEYLSSC